MGQTDVHQLREIAPAQPESKSPSVYGPVVDVADADAEHSKTILVGVQGTRLLPECLGQAIAAVGAKQNVGADAPSPRVVADDVVGAGKHHPFDAALAC